MTRQASATGRRAPARWTRWIGTAVVASLAACVPAVAQTADPPTEGRRVLERILVKVNSDIITQTDLEQRQIETLRARNLRPTSDFDLRRVLMEVTPEIISTAVDELLLVQRGRELGYQLSDEQFDEIVEGIKTENNIATDAEFEEALLQGEGLTLDDLRSTLERQMLVNQVQQVEILSKVTLTEIEARDYYESNLDEFTEPATVTMREILVRVADSGGSFSVFADDQAKADAEAARERVLAGEDFALVAIAVSDAASKANGGLIGPFDMAFLNDTVQETLAEMEIGDVSPPIRTPVGYQVLKLEDRTEPMPRPFEEVRDSIGNNVFSDRRVSEYLRFLDELRDEAVIEWKDEQLRQAFDSYDRTQQVTAGGQ